jgi:non-specific protein-tyrosine kinase
VNANDETQVSPLDYLRPVWRFKWFALLIVVVATAATYMYTNREPKKYESSTQLYVGQSDIDQLLSSTQAGSSSTDQRTLANQARLITTPQVATAVDKFLKLGRTTDDLLASISVHPDTDADFLTIVATAGTPRGAAALADAFAHEYLRVRTNTAQHEAKSQLTITKATLARTPTSNRLARSALKDRIRTLENAALDPPQSGQQLSAAEIPTSPVSPKPIRNAIFAAALALLLAIVLAYVFDRSDKRVRSVRDVEELLDLPVLASLPAVKKPLPDHGSRDAIVPELREPSHTLRVNLDLLRVKRGARVVLITSGLPGEGKSTVARNLALAYRDAGLRVALIEADMRRPTQSALLDLARGPGVAEVLQGTAQAPQAWQTMHPEQWTATGAPVAVPNGSNGTHAPTGASPHNGRLDVLVAGNGGENPGLLLYPVALRELLTQASSTHDIVLIDSPPVLMVSDAMVMAPLVDSVVLVIREGTSTRTSVERLKRTFDATPDTDLLGSIVNAVDLSSGYDGYSGYYAAYSAPVDEPAAVPPPAPAEPGPTPQP